MRPLPKSGSIVLGRGLDCDLVVDDSSVSRRHAAVHIGPPLSIEDLDSANGTRKRGIRLPARTPVELDVGEYVELGAVMVAVHYGPEERVAVTKPPPAVPPAPTRRDDSPLVAEAGPAMREVVVLLERVARGDITVLLLGETGVGKEVMAETLHRLSPRASKPFLRLHCGALPQPLLESELFGYEKGAFTGAQNVKPGLLETADGGTVLLDEIGDMPMDTQMKLLRVLEDRRVLRVGGIAPRPIAVRYVGATHRALPDLVARGEFRADLYYRLNGISIVVPPLRERASEIAPLARGFVAQAARSLGRTPPRLASNVIASLERHPWPGNVRELRNVMERAVLLCRGEALTLEHLALGKQEPAPSLAERGSNVALGDPGERQRLVDALARCAGNQTQAARLLGISRNTLLSRLDSHGLPRPRKRNPRDA
jgi:transcriptional regulator with PAS, ATPase and Fis domain